MRRFGNVSVVVRALRPVWCESVALASNVWPMLHRASHRMWLYVLLLLLHVLLLDLLKWLRSICGGSHAWTLVVQYLARETIW